MSERDRLLSQFETGVVESFDPELKRAFDVADNEVPAELKDPQKLRMQEGMFKVSGDGVFYTLQGEGPTMGLPAVFLRLHVCNLRCLHPDSMITMSDLSQKALKYIKEGDELLGVSSKAGDHVFKASKVLKVWKTDPKTCVEIIHNKLICSEDHPIYTQSGRYLEAKMVKGLTGSSLSKFNNKFDSYLYNLGYVTAATFIKRALGPGYKVNFSSLSKELVIHLKDKFKKVTAANILLEIDEMFGTANLKVSDRDLSARLLNLKYNNISWFSGYLAGWIDLVGKNQKGRLFIKLDGGYVEFEAIRNWLLKHYDIESEIRKNSLEIQLVDYDKLSFLFDIKSSIDPDLIFNTTHPLAKQPLDYRYSNYKGGLIELSTETENLFANNLLVHNCTWCDAYYTWNPKSKEFWTESKDWTIEETADKLKEAWKAPDTVQKRVIITGGEPMLQQTKIEELMDELGDNWAYEIETNGTIMPSEKIFEKAQFNCSPKLSNSGNIFNARVKPEVIQKLAQGNTTFKFVVMTDADLDEIEKDYIEGCGVPIGKVILMPQGVTAEEVRENGQRVVEYAKEKGYRLMGRLQNELWGAKRGV